jgi:hypothetical protein
MYIRTWQRPVCNVCIYMYVCKNLVSMLVPACVQPEGTPHFTQYILESRFNIIFSVMYKPLQCYEELVNRA